VGLIFAMFEVMDNGQGASMRVVLLR